MPNTPLVPYSRHITPGLVVVSPSRLATHSSTDSLGDCATRRSANIIPSRSGCAVWMKGAAKRAVASKQLNGSSRGNRPEFRNRCAMSRSCSLISSLAWSLVSALPVRAPSAIIPACSHGPKTGTTQPTIVPSHSACWGLRRIIRIFRMELE